MNKKTIIMIGTSMLIGIAAITIAVYSLMTHPRICYVRNQYVVENFEGMKDAQKLFDQKFKDQRNFLDSLQISYKTAQMNYSTSRDKTTEEQLKKIQSQLMQYNNYYKNITDEADKKMTEQVLNQINDYIKEYGDKKGYDMIVGTTSGGNLLYGTPKLDQSEELLKEINRSYKGKK
jgi:outer membrane protein